MFVDKHVTNRINTVVYIDVFLFAWWKTCLTNIDQAVFLYAFHTTKTMQKTDNVSTILAHTLNVFNGTVDVKNGVSCMLKLNINMICAYGKIWCVAGMLMLAIQYIFCADWGCQCNGLEQILRSFLTSWLYIALIECDKNLNDGCGYIGISIWQHFVVKITQTNSLEHFTFELNWDSQHCIL